jgi:hypothetical protein
MKEQEVMVEETEEDSHEETIRAILHGDETPTRKSKRKQQQSSSSSSCPFKRKMRPNMNHSIKDDPILLETFKYSRHSLRLSSSSIAAMTGFHPYTNLAKLFMDLVYQGYVGQRLLHHDAKLLGIELLSEQQVLLQLAQKAGKDVLGAVQHSMEVSKGKVKVKNVQDANDLKKDIVAKVQRSSNLSTGERNILQEATRYNINTGFGKDHEKDALDLYEKQCGWQVTCRNEDLKCWKFQLDNDGHAVPMDAPQSYSLQSVLNHEPDIITIHDDDDDDDKDDGDVVAPRDRLSTMPFFSILGVADGIRDELYHVGSTTSNENNNNNNNNNNKDDTLTFNHHDNHHHDNHDKHDHHHPTDDTKDWALRQVVIECKHRMRKAFVPPPIYDQIQLVIYCMMYGTSEGEMVQVVRNHQAVQEVQVQEVQVQVQQQEEPHQQQQPPPTEPHQQDTTIHIKESTNTTTTNTHITISRISLNENDVMKHFQNWHNTILPRLTSFVHAVYNVRANDDKRYRMIQAAAQASLGGDESKWWQILLEECPWLKDCDIALYRNKSSMDM